MNPTRSHPGGAVSCRAAPLRPAAPASVHETLQQAGAALPAAPRMALESGFERDFSQGRVHTDASAAADQVLRGDAAPHLDAAEGVSVQRVPAGDAPLASAGLNLPIAGSEIAADETISAANPKLADLASRLQAGGPAAHIEISADLGEKAGALGEMYDAVDKARVACKQAPRFKIELGAKGPLGSPPAGSDPSTRPPGYIGGSVTIPF